MLTLDLLRCPACSTSFTGRADHEADHEATGRETGIGESIECPNCSVTYERREGILDLTPPDIGDDPTWGVWREHLDAFQRRREQRVEQPSGLAGKMTISGSSQQQSFGRFTRIRDGVVVDVGCGPGKFSKHLPDAVRYVGLDPIPMPGIDGIDIVRGLAEHLPFDDGAVQHVTVLSALDHFNDVPAFVDEAHRVLDADGRLHIIQQVHEPKLSVRGVMHEVKDFIEDRMTKHDAEVPHHMTEFDEADLRRELGRRFDVEREELFSVSRLAPRRLFLTLAPRR